jgi:hypothetical protein
MVVIKSSRANKLLEYPQAFSTELTSAMRRFPDESLPIWCAIERENDVVKAISFHGEVTSWEKVVLEGLAFLLKGKKNSSLDSLTVREIEAFLRDRNSETALENLPENTEERFRKLFHWLRIAPHAGGGEEYQFSSEKGPFRSLKLVDKVRELKAFLNSPDVLSLYHHLPRPELVDVDEVTVYVQAPYQTEREKALFEELHILGVAAFQEENLNFIPEA